MYAILLLPSSNRVYAASAPALAMSELTVVNRYAFADRLTDLRIETWCGVPYLTFATVDGRPMDEAELRLLGALSTTYAVFATDGAEVDPALRPLGTAGALDRWDDDLISIPRYVGRTNEQFTKLLVNLAVVCGHGVAGFTTPHLRVLDPLCGRGTTVNQAVMYGFDAAGVEIDGRDVEAWTTFFSTWLQDKRLKHRVERNTARKTDPLKVTVSMWADKEGQRAGPGQEVVMLADDTCNTVRRLGGRCADAIAGDLPYGVRHGSHSGSRLARSPEDLLTEALPVWREALRPGCVMAMAWNARSLPSEAVTAALVAAGLQPVEVGDGVSFRHRVDRVITRDVFLARRPPAR